MENICESYSFLSVIVLVKYIIGLIQLIIPILLIFFISFDFIKAIVTNDEKLRAKAISTSGKRIFYAVLFFVVPTILSLLIGVLDNSTDSKNAFLSCYNNASMEKVESLKVQEKNLKEIENQKIEAEREKRRVERENNNKIREEAEKKNKENNKTSSSNTNVDPNLCSGDSCTGTATFDPNDLTKPSNLTVSELTLTITKYAEGRDSRVKNFIPLAPAFIKAEKDHGINAIGIMSIDAHESGWASERLARLCNNLGGYRGKGTRPCSVSNHEGGFSGYNSKEEFIDKQASKLKTNYLTPGGKYFNGKGLSGIAQKYLTTGKDHWINNISKIGTTMAKKAKEVTGR